MKLVVKISDSKILKDGLYQIIILIYTELPYWCKKFCPTYFWPKIFSKSGVGLYTGGKLDTKFSKSFFFIRCLEINSHTHLPIHTHPYTLHCKALKVVIWNKFCPTLIFFQCRYFFLIKKVDVISSSVKSSHSLHVQTFRYIDFLQNFLTFILNLGI